MLYSRELLGLMRPFPGRRFQMAQLVGFVMRDNRDDAKAREAARKAVRRVLDRLHAEGFVVIDPAKVQGGSARFYWREDPPPAAALEETAPRDTGDGRGRSTPGRTCHQEGSR